MDFQIDVAKKAVSMSPSDLKKHILAADTAKVSAEVLTSIKNSLASDANINDEVRALTYTHRTIQCPPDTHTYCTTQF